MDGGCYDSESVGGVNTILELFSTRLVTFTCVDYSGKKQLNLTSDFKYV